MEYKISLIYKLEILYDSNKSNKCNYIYINCISLMLSNWIKRTIRKRFPYYRLVTIENGIKRDSRSIDEVGYYNPLIKKSNFGVVKIKKLLSYGAPIL